MFQTCGADDSAYIYESTDGRWHRIWESEQTNYEEKTYFPQRLVDVKISPTDWYSKSDYAGHLIVTTGVFPWCSSVWQPVYYRVWQTKSNYPDARLLLNGSEQADIAAPIHARAYQKEVLIEFQVIADDAMRVPNSSTTLSKTIIFVERTRGADASGVCLILATIRGTKSPSGQVRPAARA